MSQVRYLVLRCSASRCVTCNLTGIFYFSNKFLHLTGVRLQRAVEFVFALVGLHLFYDFFFPFEKICLEWRPLMSCFRTSHHTRIHQSDCLLRSFFSFCSCCEGGKTPRKIARACLCKQRKDFCRNEELALVKSTLVCCTCTDFSPSLRHQSESHAFTSVCHFVWHFPFFFFLPPLAFGTNCKAGKVWLHDFYPFLSSGPLSASLCFSSSPSRRRRHRLSCSSWQHFYVNKPNRERQTKLANHRIDNNTRPDSGWCPNEPRVLASSLWLWAIMINSPAPSLCSTLREIVNFIQSTKQRGL